MPRASALPSGESEYEPPQQGGSSSSQPDSLAWLGPLRDRAPEHLAMAPSARKSATRASTESSRSEWLVVDKPLAADESSLRGRVGAPIRWDALNVAEPAAEKAADAQ